MNRSTFTTLFLLACLSFPLSAQTENPVEAGTPYEGSLEAGVSHFYTIDVDGGSFIHGTVNQRSVDVVVKITDADGKSLGQFDGPARGLEQFQVETKSATRLRIEIAPFKGASGDYTLLVDRVEDIATDPGDRLDQLMAAWSGPDIPGCVIGVYRGGKIVTEKAYGMADLSQGVPFTAETPCNIGSVSKQFTAFGVMLLARQGKLSLDDDIRVYLPELPAFTDTTRIRHLLTHTGGYREVYNTVPMAGWGYEDALSRGDVVDMVKRQDKLQSKPGAGFRYNNTGYILLGLLIERVSGTPFAEWMQANVFAPLGMTHTLYKTVRGQVIPGAAMGYVPGEDGAYRAAGDFDASAGAGGVHTTLADAGKWLHNFSTQKVGGAEALRMLTTRAVLATGDTIGYACGIGVGTYRGLRTLDHGGADIAHRAQLVIFPDIDAGVFVMSNNAGFNSAVVDRIADMFFEKDMEKQVDAGEDAKPIDAAAKVDTTAFDRAAGTYAFTGIPMQIEYSRVGLSLFAQATGQPEVGITAESDSVYGYVGVPGARVTFHLPAKGRCDSATHFQGRSIGLKRVASYTPDAATLASCEGLYFSAELDMVLHCAVENDTLRFTHARMTPVPLIPAVRNEFTGDSVFNTVKFERDAEGIVTGFTVSNARTVDVRFVRMK